LKDLLAHFNTYSLLQDQYLIYGRDQVHGRPILTRFQVQTPGSIRFMVNVYRLMVKRMRYGGMGFSKEMETPYANKWYCYQLRKDSTAGIRKDMLLFTLAASRLISKVFLFSPVVGSEPLKDPIRLLLRVREAFCPRRKPHSGPIEL